MEKTISRELKVYRYTFAVIDTATLSASDITILTTTKKLSARAVNAKSKELDGRTMINVSEETKKYSLPLDRFIEACETYAAEFDENSEDEETNEN